MPFGEIPAFMERPRAETSTAAKALEWIILTAARSGEAMKGHLAEISEAEKSWIIAGHRMKAGEEHRVPLVPRALDILKTVERPDGCAHLFPGLRRGKPLTVRCPL